MRDVELKGRIGMDCSGYEICEDLLEASLLDNQIRLIIDSPGGDCFEALSIYNTIKGLQAKGVSIIAQVDVLAASAASFIACACDRVEMKSYALMMLHNAGMYVRSASDQDLLDKINQIMQEIYATRTKKSVKEIAKMLQNDLWLTADEAVAMGLVDEKLVEESTSAEIVAKLEQIHKINIDKNDFAKVTALYVHKKETTVNMFENIQAVLEIASADEKSITSKIVELLEQKKQATASIESKDLEIAELKSNEIKLQETIKAFEDQAKAEVERRANELIDEAVKSLKISASVKDVYVKFATADFEGTKKILSAMKNNTLKLADIISKVEGQDSKQPEFTLTPTDMLLKSISEKNNKK
jgi:ATP-dependent protease ClpP protease subunit